MRCFETRKTQTLFRFNRFHNRFHNFMKPGMKPVPQSVSQIMKPKIKPPVHDAGESGFIRFTTTPRKGWVWWCNIMKPVSRDGIFGQMKPICQLSVVGRHGHRMAKP